MIAGSVLISAMLMSVAAMAMGMQPTAHAQSTSNQIVTQAAPETPPTPRKKPRTVRNAPPTMIACTQLGCGPVPPGCYPVGGRTIRGNPSGYDVVVCPYR